MSDEYCKAVAEPDAAVGEPENQLIAADVGRFFVLGVPGKNIDWRNLKIVKVDYTWV